MGNIVRRLLSLINGEEASKWTQFIQNLEMFWADERICQSIESNDKNMLKRFTSADICLAYRSQWKDEWAFSQHYGSSRSLLLWLMKATVLAESSFMFSLGSLHHVDVYRRESGRCCSLPFFVTFFIIPPFQIFLLY